MPVTDTVKRWVISGKGDATEGQSNFYDFLKFLQTEQDNWVPCPGYLIDEPVPDTMEKWAAITERLKANPRPERLAELERRFKDAPYSSEKSWTRMIMKEELGHEFEKKRTFEYLPPDFQTDEPILLWALTLPTEEDKVMALSKVPQESQRGWPVVVHIAQFDDLMEGPEAELRTGYKIVHDILPDEIVITKIEFEVPEKAPKKWRQLHPRPEEEDWIRVPPEKRWNESEWMHIPRIRTRSFKAQARRSLLFRGSPAALADHIIRRSLTNKIHPGFDMVLRLIAAEYILENAAAIKLVEHPREHRYTFNEQLKEDLTYWWSLQDPRKLQFPNQWTRSTVDLKGFENQKKRERRKRRQAKKAGGETEIELELEADWELGGEKSASEVSRKKENEAVAGAKEDKFTREVTMEEVMKAKMKAARVMAEAEADMKARLEAARWEVEMERLSLLEVEVEEERLGLLTRSSGPDKS